MPELNTAVISRRLLTTLRRPGMEASETLVDVLLRFQDEASLNQFAADPAGMARRIGVAPEAIRLKRVVAPLRYVAMQVEARAIAALSGIAGEVGVTIIDENTRVMMFVRSSTAGREASPPPAARPGVFGLTGKGIRIAVLDTGVDAAHPDLGGRIADARDFTGDGGGDHVGHGTHCGGLIAGTGSKNPSFRALAWEAEIIDVKVLDNEGAGRVDAILEGLVWAVNEARAQVVSMSLGSVGDFDGTEPLSEAVDWAVSKGVHVFVAAGNCGPGASELRCATRGARSIASPGVAANVITVGATDQMGNIADFSSRGPTPTGLIKPDVVVVGGNVVSTRATQVDFGQALDPFYTRASGTSMATPQCAAVGAIVLEAAARDGVSLSPADLKAVLKDSARPIPNVSPTWQGAGVVDPARCIALVRERFVHAAQPSAPDRVIDLALAPEDPGGASQHVRGSWRITARNRGTVAVYDLKINLGGSGVRVETMTSDAVSISELAAGGEVHGNVWITPNVSGSLQLILHASYKTGRPGTAAASEVVLTENVVSMAVGKPVGAATATDVAQAVARASELLLARQRPNGSWAGDIMFNAWTNGMYCILHKILQLDGEPTAALRWLEAHRTGLDEQSAPDGTYGIVDIPSPHMIEATLASSVALEVWGRPRDERGWEFIRRMSAARLANVIDQCDPFTQTFISLASAYRPAGQPPYYSLSDVLIPPIELVAIPSFLPESISSLFAAWGLDAIVALAAIGTVARNPQPTVLQQVLLRKAERHLLRQQSDDGGWYGTILPTFACTLGMHFLGYPNEHPVMVRALQFMRGQQRVDGYIVRYELPVWDTALAIIALTEAGLAAADPRLLRGASYLRSAQAPSGGVAFKTENIRYPDTDDTAFAALAVERVAVADPDAKEQFQDRALRWLLYMQGRDGGWAAFSKDQAHKAPDRAPVFKDDPPTADVTAHVLSALKLARNVDQATAAQDARQRAFDWLLQQQLPGGGWYGRWGMTVTYGTVAVLQAVEDLGERPDQPFIRAAVRYLVSKQQHDGGWGEGYRTYYDVNAVETAPSTVEQTAWSILGLLSVPVTQESRPAIEKGVQFLMERFDGTVGWGAGSYVVGALWIYKHDLYPLIWPIWALSKYLKTMKGQS